jgi:hypothetical protein
LTEYSSVVKSKDRLVVWCACVIAAVRVFVYSAAFPFFNNVDEPWHFDLVVKYSHGQVPSRLEPFSTESSRYITLFASPEYLVRPEQFEGGKIPPPLSTLPQAESGSFYTRISAIWLKAINHEASSPPLYYVAAGSWLRLGRLLGIDELGALYWIRFLNVFVMVALVRLGFGVGRMVFPESRFLRIGVAWLLAFFPQDAFYSIQSDVLSPLCFGLAFACVAKFWLADRAPRLRWYVAAGLALAVTALVKVSNLPLVGVAFVAVLYRARYWAEAGQLRDALPGLGLMALCAAVPVGSWMIWSHYAFGDLTGSSVKVASLGWTRKPITDWVRHPLFTPAGMWQFTSEFMASFWRGEFVWGFRRLASPAMDALYTLSSTIFVAVSACTMVRASSDTTVEQRRVLRLALASFAMAVMFPALLSTVFDFGNCVYPSREHPYFTSGRLASGALIPFLVLYVYGLDQSIGGRRNHSAHWWVLGGFVALSTFSEIIVSFPVFFSQYNWFHMYGH